MVTTFNSKDMVRFGEYLLSEKRTNSIKSHHKKEDNIPLEERLREVYHADFENWKDSIKESPSNLLHEFFNSRSDANKYLEASKQEDLEKDFDVWYRSR